LLSNLNASQLITHRMVVRKKCTHLLLFLLAGYCANPLFAQVKDSIHIYRDEARRCIYRNQWYEAPDLAKLSQTRGYTRATCLFRKSTDRQRAGQVLAVTALGTAVLGYMSTWQEGVNAVAGGFLITAGTSGIASVWYSLSAQRLTKRGIRAFNRAADLEQDSAGSQADERKRNTSCERLPLLANGEDRLVKHRFNPNSLSDMVAFDGQLMSLEKAADYADANHIAGAGDLLRQLAALPRPKENLSIGPITLNDKQMRDYTMAKNELVKQIMASVRQHNRLVRKQA